MNDWFSRRVFLVGATAFSLASRMVVLAGTGNQTVAEELVEFDYSAVELTGGPLKEQYGSDPRRLSRSQY